MQNDGMVMAKEQELALPVLPPGSVEVFNAFYRQRWPLNTVLAGRRLSIEPSWSAADEHASGCVIHLDIDGEEGELKVPPALLDLLLSGVDGAPPLHSLSPGHAAIVVEFALSEALQALEARLGCNVTIVSVSTSGESQEDPLRPPLSFALNIDGTGAAWSELRLIPDQAIRLAQYLDSTAGTRAADLDLPFVMCLRLASVTVTAGEVARLAPGDVVLADEICVPGSAVLVIGDYLGAPVALTDEGAQLAAVPAPLHGSTWEWAMDRETQASPRDANDAGGVDGVPLRLMFDLGRLELQLRQFGELMPGAPLPFMPSADGMLDIFAGGKRIGKGILLQVGASLGVKITRLAGPKTGTTRGGRMS